MDECIDRLRPVKVSIFLLGNFAWELEATWVIWSAMSNQLKSLAYHTDLSFLKFEGRVEDCGAYYFAETPDNPGYFWGNLLVMKEPPKLGDLARWTAIFQKCFAHQPLVRHMTLGWDSPEGSPGEIEPFRAAGFDVEQSVILTATKDDIRAPLNMNTDVLIRPLESEADWRAAIDLQVACRRDTFRADMYLPFKEKQMAKYRRMAQAGLGHWYGAFLDERLVGDCGLFSFDGIGRYQAVETDAEFRRRGICAALIYHTSRMVLASNAHTLVMAADPEYHAARVYKSIGFKERERQIGVYRWPKDEWTE